MKYPHLPVRKWLVNIVDGDQKTTPLSRINGPNHGSGGLFERGPASQPAYGPGGITLYKRHRIHFNGKIWLHRESQGLMGVDTSARVLTQHIGVNNLISPRFPL